MLSMALSTQSCGRSSNERKTWDAAARNDVFGFLAQSLGLVAVAMFLYALGPALGVTLIAVGFVVAALLRSQIAAEEESSQEDDDGHVAATEPSHCANPVWLRNIVTSSEPTAPVVRQGV